MQIAIQAGSSIRMKRGRVQMGLSGMIYFTGYSQPLNWMRGAAISIRKTDFSGVAFDDAGIAAGYWTPEGNISPTAPSDTYDIQILFYASNGDPTQNLAGETFTVYYDGIASNVAGLSLTNIVHTPAEKKVTFTVQADANSVVYLRVDPANRSTPPTNPRIIQNRYLNDTVLDGITYLGYLNGGEFNPHWLHLIRGHNPIRFMDLMLTNWSTITNFSDFTSDAAVNWTRTGIPLSAICRIAQSIGCDAHINIPHKLGSADADVSMVQFAEFWRDNFPANQRIHVEYSNELWNLTFHDDSGRPGQYTFANSSAASKGLPVGAGWQFTGYRAAECLKIWRDVFANRRRWRGVLATQTVNTAVTTQMIAGFDAWKAATGNRHRVKDLFNQLDTTGYFAHVVSSWAITNIVKGATTTVTFLNDVSSEMAVGQKLVIGLRGTGMGMPQIDGTYGTILSNSGDTFTSTVTLDINSSGYTDWVNDGQTYAAPAEYFLLEDESRTRNLADNVTYPSPYSYFRTQFAQLILTGACDFGLTLTGSAVVENLDTYWLAQKAIANTYELELRQYEGGLHFTGSTMINGQPSVNAVGNRLKGIIVDFGHSPECAELYRRSYRLFYEIGGTNPSKFTEGGGSSIVGAWGMVRSWPCEATPNGDFDNPIAQVVQAENAARFAA